MKIASLKNNRRDFLKKCGMSTMPLMVSTFGLGNATYFGYGTTNNSGQKKAVNFISDGLFFSPKEYIETLNAIEDASPINADFYGNGGATKLLEDKFAELTGKEKAIYLPTGTMANQLAIKLLNGDNTKAIVPENSHVFRDEADAAQSVHNKRLIPVGKGKPYFEVEDLKNTIDYTNENEVFKSGLGTVVIESPVRRADGSAVPIKTISAISGYCKENGYKLHLDGARLHFASAYKNVPIAEYAAYFDTVYISLYKYLNAAGGAILCGDSKVIDRISHQIKIYGGTVFQSWANTSVALHYLGSIEKQLAQVVKTADTLISELNKINKVEISAVKNGTNVYHLKLSGEVSLKALATYLHNEHNIWLGRVNEEGIIKLILNESLLSRPLNEILGAWTTGIDLAKK